MEQRSSLRRLSVARIYLSSTPRDLVTYREAVSTTLRAMGHPTSMMVWHHAEEEQGSLLPSLSEIAACDLYIGIFAWDAGPLPSQEHPEHPSLSQLEYRKARQMGKACLLFLFEQNATWKPAF